MKTISPVSVFRALVLAVVCTSFANAQTFTDTLSSSTNTWNFWAPTPTTGSLTFANSRLEYTSPISSPPGEFAALTLSNYQAPYTSDWSVQVDVHLNNALNFTVVTSWIDLNLIVGKAQSSFGSSRLFSATMERWTSAGPSSANNFGGSSFIPGGDSDDFTSVTNNVSDGALRIAFNSTTKSLSAFYDANGATGGYSWTLIDTRAIGTGNPDDMGMNDSNTFAISLVADAGINSNAAPDGILVSTGDAYFQNLSGTGLVAVPEPSTYALIAGASAFVFAAFRRRRMR